MVCAAASCRLSRRATQRSGGRTGLIVPRSGHVPTTTSQPDATSRPTVSPSSRTLRAAGACRVTSLAPIISTATSGRCGSASSSWRARSPERAPDFATFTSRTRRSATEASPEESSAPGVSCTRWTPSPAAVESPRNASTSGGRRSAGSANASPYSPSACGGSPSRIPIARTAIRLSVSSTPASPTPSSPSPPPPYAAAVAIRRATRALDACEPAIAATPSPVSVPPHRAYPDSYPLSRPPYPPGPGNHPPEGASGRRGSAGTCGGWVRWGGRGP